jgi:hypothetical protein
MVMGQLPSYPLCRPFKLNSPDQNDLIVFNVKKNGDYVIKMHFYCFRLKEQ